MRLRSWASCVALTLGWASLAWGAEPAAGLQPCRVSGGPHAFLCGQLQRPLDPAQPQGPTIDVHYVVAPALARHKHPDPVFLLAGGPGQSAVSLLPQVWPLFARLNNRRDIVFVDQRGTGRSAPLLCEPSASTEWAEAAETAQQLQQVQRCREALQALPTWGSAQGLKFFSTTVAMQDLDAVRQHLGAKRINLVAASYGTRAALEYQRQFPGAVRRSVLDGVAPPDMALPASMSPDTQAVLERLFAACSDEPACAQAYPRLRSDWAQLLASLPQTVTLEHPLTGQPLSITLTRDRVLSAARGALYSPVLVSALPVAITDAAQGRVQGLLGLGRILSARKDAAAATGMHFSVVCAEDLPRMSQALEPIGADFGDSQARFYQQACAHWPRAEVPAGFYTVPPSLSPVLLLSGGLDPVTPPRHGEKVARALGPQARHLVVDHAGHGVMSIGCLPEVWFRFIDARDDAAALAVDASCAKSIPRPWAFRPVALSPQGAPR